MSLCGDSLALLQIFSNAHHLFWLALASSLFLIVLVYLINFILRDEKIAIWVKGELWNLLANALITFLMLSLLQLMASSLTSSSSFNAFLSPLAISLPSSGDCGFEIAYNYALSLASSALSLDAVMSWANLHIKYITQISVPQCVMGSNIVSSIVCISGGGFVSIEPFKFALWFASNIDSFQHILLTTIIAFSFLQAFLVKFFLQSGFIYLLSVMTILKLLPFTKEFGSIVFSLLFAFLIVYPLLILLESPILGTMEEQEILAGVDVASISQASSLSSLKFSSADYFAYFALSDLYEIWDIKKTSNNDVCIMKYEDEVVCFNRLVEAYANILFRVVLFFTINLIAMALVIRRLVTLVGGSENLLEVFIRVGGLITW